MTIDETLPEVVQNFLRAGHKLERIELRANGQWKHEGLDFENPKVISLFFRSVARTAGGTWVLSIPPFTYPIEVERTGFFVTSVDPATGLISLSDETCESLDPHTVHYEPDGRMFCRVKDGAFEARFLKGAYYRFAELIDEHDDTLAFEWLGEHHVLRQI